MTFRSMLAHARRLPREVRERRLEEAEQRLAAAPPTTTDYERHDLQSAVTLWTKALERER